MRICHLTTVHDWNDVRIFVKMCQSASSEGCPVDLIAPVRWNNPVIDSGAITVHGLRRYRRRILRASLGTLRAIRKATTIRASIYHLHDPELLPAVIALRFLGRRVVFDFHEEFSAQMRGKPYLGRRSRAIAFRLARCWELILCGAASKIVTATPRIRDRLPIRSAAATVVYNFPSLDEFPAPTRTRFDRRTPSAYYVGGVTEIRGCIEMVQAARVLASTGSNIVILIAGPFQSSAFERKMREAADGLNVEILGTRTRDEVMADLDDARVGLVLFQPHPNHCQSLPNKLFEYMAAGVAVVASNFPLWTQILERSGCGVTADPRDPKAIASAIREVVDDPARAQEMGRRGRIAVEQRYHWPSEWKSLRKLYRTMAR